MEVAITRIRGLSYSSNKAGQEDWLSIGGSWRSFRVWGLVMVLRTFPSTLRSTQNDPLKCSLASDIVALFAIMEPDW